jgi:hypothetical protein
LIKPAPPAGGHCSPVEAQRSRAMFKQNVGGIDRTLRVILGVGVLSLAFVGPQSPWGYLGLIPLLTGLAGTCPLYSLLGLRTCKARPWQTGKS